MLKDLPSVLWRWLGGRKGIRPVKTEWWGAGVVICLQRGADLHMTQLTQLTHSLSLASVKSRLVLPLWYRLTWVVPDKGPLNGCVMRECSKIPTTHSRVHPTLPVAILKSPQKFGWQRSHRSPPTPGLHEHWLDCASHRRPYEPSELHWHRPAVHITPGRYSVLIKIEL